MTTVPNLLNDDGTASVATGLLMSHHGLRRDIGRFAAALDKVAQGDVSRVDALREEWKNYHQTLHHHHQAEDTGIFPGLSAQHESVRATIEGLSADHRRIDPLLERGDGAFAELPNASAAIAIVRELSALLDRHLAVEEAEIVPFLRDVKGFPPMNDEMIGLYAQGFAWSMDGIAADVLEKVYATLPPNLLERLPAARAAFEARCERVWGPLKRGAARTPIPDTPV